MKVVFQVCLSLLILCTVRHTVLASKTSGTLPVRQALQTVQDISVYRCTWAIDHLTHGSSPAAHLNVHSHPALFRLLRTTHQFGPYGRKASTHFCLVFQFADHASQAFYYYGGLLDGGPDRQGIVPQGFQNWMRQLEGRGDRG